MAVSNLVVCNYISNVIITSTVMYVCACTHYQACTHYWLVIVIINSEFQGQRASILPKLKTQNALYNTIIIYVCTLSICFLIVHQQITS